MQNLPGYHVCFAWPSHEGTDTQQRAMHWLFDADRMCTGGKNLPEQLRCMHECADTQPLNHVCLPCYTNTMCKGVQNIQGCMHDHVTSAHIQHTTQTCNCLLVTQHPQYMHDAACTCHSVVSRPKYMEHQDHTISGHTVEVRAQARLHLAVRMQQHLP